MKLINSISNLMNFLMFLFLYKQVYCMGTNCSGCLGVGDNANTLEPRRLEELNGLKVISVAAGSGPHVLLLTEGKFVN